MKYIKYPLFAEGYINRFITTGIYTKPQTFVKSVLSGKVNEWLKSGFSIHENPCRKEFVQKRQNELPPYIDLSENQPGEAIRVFDTEKKLHMYFPFGNIGVEESGFYYTPTFLRTYSYTIIEAEEEALADFELSTCGGVTMWVNGELLIDFTPFTRNLVKSTMVTVNLKAGKNKLIICLDDLAERDTDYYFRLRRVGNSCLSILLPVKEDIPIEQLKAMERMLDDIYFKKEAYISEPMEMQIPNYTGCEMSVKVTITPGDFIEKMENQEDLIETKYYRLGKNDNSLRLLNSDEIRPGYYYFTPSLTLGGIEMKRKIGNQLVRKDFLLCHEPDLEERKKQAMIAVLIYGIDNVYKAAIMLKFKMDTQRAEQIIFGELDGVRNRKDCSDFHFIIIIYIYKTFGHIISDKLKAKIENTMQNYRYWIDEPGDDVMWFFSENHALLFHTCQYLAGGCLPRRVFTNSGMTGEKLRQKAIGLLDEWFENFFNEFITEWNSSAYIPVDVLGLGTLYNLTKNNDPFHIKAKRALDMIFYCLCVNQHKGAVMTSFGRTYEKEMKGSFNAGTTGLLHVAYNAGYLNRAVMGYLPLLLGDYEAPDEYRKYLNLSGSQELIHQNTQGFEKHVNLYLYKNADVLLSTAIGYKPYRPGYQEHIVQAVIDERAQVFVNHPGESHPYGSGRPNFWAGNGILPMAMQHKGISILKYDINKSHRIDYTHAYIPLSEFKHYRGETKYEVALEKDGAYIGVKALNGLKMQEKGPCCYREFISPGRENVWVIKVAGSSDYDSLEKFSCDLRKIEISLNRDKEVTVTDKDFSYFIDKTNNCYVNGEIIYEYPLSIEGKTNVKGTK